MKEWFIGRLPLVDGQLAYTTQGHLPRGGTTQSRLAPPLTIDSPFNSPQTYPQTNLTWEILQLRHSFPKGPLVVSN